MPGLSPKHRMEAAACFHRFEITIYILIWGTVARSLSHVDVYSAFDDEVA
jgi:hypothetical protein